MDERQKEAWQRSTIEQTMAQKRGTDVPYQLDDTSAQLTGTPVGVFVEIISDNNIIERELSQIVARLKKVTTRVGIGPDELTNEWCADDQKDQEDDSALTIVRRQHGRIENLFRLLIMQVERIECL